MTNAPILSILLPVYNGAAYLKPAIDSLLSQTLQNFEILVFDDASQDQTGEILKSYTDRRIKVHRKSQKTGLAACLNEGIYLARGTFIARMDSDDLAIHDRFEKQIQFLKKNPQISMVGGWIRRFRGPVGRLTRLPERHEEIRSTLLFECAFAHPTVLFRKADFIREQLFYQTEWPRAEDYELWGRVVEKLKTANLPEVLLQYRLHGKQLGTSSARLQLDWNSQVRLEIFQRMGFVLSSEERQLHDWLCGGVWPLLSEAELQALSVWVQRLRSNLSRYPDFDLATVDRLIQSFWTKAAFTHFKNRSFFEKMRGYSYFSSTILEKQVVAFYLLKGLRRKRS